MERRAFLSLLAGSPLVFGLRELLAQEPASEKSAPEWYKAALKRMKETHRYGIVIVVPDDPKERDAWGRALIARYSSTYRHEPWGVVVFVCLTKSVATSLGHATDFNVFVLDPDGRTVQRAREHLATLENDRSFEFAFSSYAYGLRDARLVEQARAIEKGIPESLRTAADDLLVRTLDVPRESPLYEKADALLPWIVNKCREAESKDPRIDGDSAEPRSLRMLVLEHASRQSHKESDPALPFGIKVEMTRPEDPCPPCGMSVVSLAKARKFLSFLEK
jgi:hypothetical protein